MSEAIPLVFLSHSAREAKAARFVYDLISGLDRHALRVWVYRARGSEIPIGRSVEDYCLNMIERSALFVAVVTDEAFGSKYAQAEVTYALDRYAGGAFPIVPIVLCERPPSEWPEPYSAIHTKFGLRWEPADCADSVCLEESIRGIVDRLDISYVPPTRDPRLPLMRRLSGELDHATIIPGERHVADGNRRYIELQALRAQVAYAEGDHSRALQLVTGIRGQLESMYEPGNGDAKGASGFYYPRLIECVLRLEAARGRRPEIRRIVDELEAMVAEGGPSDENLPAAIGGALVDLDDHVGALGYFELAHREARSLDLDIVQNLVLAAVQAGRPVPASARRDLDAGLQGGAGATTSRPPDAPPVEHDRLRLLASIVRVREDQVVHDDDEATLDDRRLVLAHDDLAILLADQVQSLARRQRDPVLERRAERMYGRLVEALPAEKATAVLHRLARARLERGAFEQAADAYENLNRRRCGVPQFLAEGALSEIGARRPKVARCRCLEATKVRVHVSELDLPPEHQIADTEYYRGLAHYLLGEQEAAAACFNRSERRPAEAYDRVIANLRLEVLARSVMRSRTP